MKKKVLALLLSVSVIGALLTGCTAGAPASDLTDEKEESEEKEEEKEESPESQGSIEFMTGMQRYCFIYRVSKYGRCICRCQSNAPAIELIIRTDQKVKLRQD